MGRNPKGKRHPNYTLTISALVLFFLGGSVLWVASLRIPALEDLSERKVVEATKIFDRTGEVLLYDMSRDLRRELVPFENISPYARDAALAIEDQDFYEHNGFKLLSFLRAVFVNLTTLSYSQGGSTITQQVVKNSILTKDKSLFGGPTRKLKELILALKLEKVLTKEEILTLYLNEIPYGGNIYGIEEAAQNFFAKSAADLSLAEASYLAALPRAPTFYSPYGPNRERLEERQELVLYEMLSNNFITQDEFASAIEEEVVFQPKINVGRIKAPHFVFFVIQELTKKYGEEALLNNGYRVITTLDYDIQAKAEAVALKYGETNQTNFAADNNALVAIDPKTGGILAMVGSRNYFDEEIDGNFNAATGFRQPGSTFKPFVYATLFGRGYTDRTVLFDTPVQFGARCAPDYFVTDENCYSPGNFDDRYRGPITVRNALGQSVNIPAVQALYLAGVEESIATAKSMGIETLNEPASRYGLSLVLGGGEVSLLDMTSAYSVFANDGIRNSYNAILRIETKDGNVAEQYRPFPRRVLSTQVARTISDILSDNIARTPAFGAYSPLYVPDRDVAAKTGTSNDFRDTWIIGYSPNIVVGAWVGNNDNTPMEKRVAGQVVAPLWREVMDRVLPSLPREYFPEPEPEDEESLKPILAGDWTGGSNEAHSILYWVEKDNPRGPIPSRPENDSQFANWEYAVTRWVTLGGNVAPPPVPEL